MAPLTKLCEFCDDEACRGACERARPRDCVHGHGPLLGVRKQIRQRRLGNYWVKVRYCILCNRFNVRAQVAGHTNTYISNELWREIREEAAKHKRSGRQEVQKLLAEALARRRA